MLFASPMARLTLSMLCRLPVSGHLLDSVESSMCALWPAIGLLALMVYCSHSGAKLNGST